MEVIASRAARFLLAAISFLLPPVIAIGQSIPDPQVPENFNLDMKSAQRLHSALMTESTPANGPYATAALVLERLTGVLEPELKRKIGWQLRIVPDNEFNAYSSPDGIVYVESGLARIAGPSSGLWAAILSHEVAHIARRDWARRYLYQKYLENHSSMSIILGDPGLPDASWSASEKASGELARFCRQMEVEADREGLMLMARAGYHPDFMPALHHLLHAQQPDSKTVSLYAMHPCWEQRDQELSRSYVTASIEFDHRWPDWYSSPGGNPPVVVFAGEPAVHRNSGEFELRVPIRCQNLAGAVEVVLQSSAMTHARPRKRKERASVQPVGVIRQLTGCTSPRTTVTFTVPKAPADSGSQPAWTDLYVLDAWGAILTRAEVPKLH